jgi:hypothetical protein
VLGWEEWGEARFTAGPLPSLSESLLKKKKITEEGGECERAEGERGRKRLGREEWREKRLGTGKRGTE